MKQVEVAAKSKEMAIMDGLNQLGVSYDRVKIEVLSEGGIFTKCRLKMTVIEEEEDLEELLRSDLPRERESRTREESKPKPAKENQERQPAKAERSERPQEDRKRQAQKPKEDRKPREEQRQREDRKPKEDRKPREERVEKELSPLEQPTIDRAAEILTKLIERMNITATVEVKREDGNAILNVVTEDAACIIGYRGETLDAIQTLIHTSINTEGDRRIIVNCQEYRERRFKSLSGLADKMANKAVAIGRKVRLEPMSSYERRIIHSHLSANNEVFTRSEGDEPQRHVVVFPKNYNKQNKNKSNSANKVSGFSENYNYVNNKSGGNALGGSSAFSENANKKRSGFGEHDNKKRF